jgi:1-deoxy-D-xylulose-5-phosphate synthase
MALCLKIPGMTIFAPSSAQEVGVMLETALGLTGPAAIRWPRTSARYVGPDQVGHGLSARKVRTGQPGQPGSVCLLAVGKMLEAAEEAAELLAADGEEVTVWDVRVVRPLDPQMIADAGRHDLIVTIEDGVRAGGAGSLIADAVADLHESRTGPPVLTLGVPVAYIPHGTAEVILAQLGLDGPGIAAAVAKTLPHRDELGE